MSIYYKNKLITGSSSGAADITPLTTSGEKIASFRSSGGITDYIYSGNSSGGGCLIDLSKQPQEGSGSGSITLTNDSVVFFSSENGNNSFSLSASNGMTTYEVFKRMCDEQNITLYFEKGTILTYSTADTNGKIHAFPVKSSSGSGGSSSSGGMIIDASKEFQYGIPESNDGTGKLTLANDSYVYIASGNGADAFSLYVGDDSSGKCVIGKNTDYGICDDQNISFYFEKGTHLYFTASKSGVLYALPIKSYGGSSSSGSGNAIDLSLGNPLPLGHESWVGPLEHNYMYTALGSGKYFYISTVGGSDSGTLLYASHSSPIIKKGMYIKSQDANSDGTLIPVS